MHHSIGIRDAEQRISVLRAGLEIGKEASLTSNLSRCVLFTLPVVEMIALTSRIASTRVPSI